MSEIDNIDVFFDTFKKINNDSVNKKRENVIDLVLNNKMEIINTLTDYISPTYTQKSKDVFSRLPLDKYKLLLNMYSNQIDINYSDYILFKLEDQHMNVEIVNNYSTISDENTYIVIYYDPTEKSYLFQTFDFTNMFELIISNANRYVFVPIMFSLKDSKIISTSSSFSSFRYFFINSIYNSSAIGINNSLGIVGIVGIVFILS